MEKRRLKRLEFSQVAEIAGRVKELEAMEDDSDLNTEYVDAFVAMGGGPGT